MNVRYLMSMFAVAGILAAGAAHAAPTVGTAKARGDYRSFSQTQQSTARSQPMYRRSAPMTHSAPMIVQSRSAMVAPAPAVAQAPSEARRFSYDPATATLTTTACPPSTTTVDSGRRFSYAPESMGAVSSPGVYSSGPGYSRSRTGAAHVDRWALPKTDPRKYNGR